MDDNELEQEILLLDALEERNMRAFMQLYKNYGEDLLIFAYAHLRDPRLAAKTVDDLFESLWSDADFAAIKPPIYNYLLDQIKKICKQKHW
jgi:DNA-directed RNA polymerase specialized sigma24 family protein